ncbi:MAG: hypothetical protein ABIL16_01990 [candidate division WOR-3 bacterium]
MFGIFEISHYFYRDYGWTNAILHGGNSYIIFQDYLSSSIGKRTRTLNAKLSFHKLNILSDNTSSVRSSEYSLGISYKISNIEVGGDLRFIRSGIITNNSGIFLLFSPLNLRVEYRPLLKTLFLSPNIRITKFNHKFTLSSNAEYFKYSLPGFSEEGYRYNFRPSISFGKSIGYNAHVLFENTNYITSPTKNRQTTLGYLELFLNQNLWITSHNIKLLRSLGETNFPAFSSDKWEDVIRFDYSPKIYDFIGFNLYIRRLLNIYSGVLDYQSFGLRETFSEGEVLAKDFKIYLSRKREDYVYLHPLRSSESKGLTKYSLGFNSYMGSITIRGELVAIYTLYRFKPSENNLSRYLEIEINYKGNAEGNFKIRFSDIGWLSNNIYYRTLNYTNIYSQGWVPLLTVLNSKIGGIFGIKPDGAGVGIGSRFPGGEMYIMKRAEDKKRFWEFSLRFSTPV